MASAIDVFELADFIAGGFQARQVVALEEKVIDVQMAREIVHFHERGGKHGEREFAEAHSRASVASIVVEHVNRFILQIFERFDGTGTSLKRSKNRASGRSGSGYSR